MLKSLFRLARAVKVNTKALKRLKVSDPKQKASSHRLCGWLWPHFSEMPFTWLLSLLYGYVGAWGLWA